MILRGSDERDHESEEEGSEDHSEEHHEDGGGGGEGMERVDTATRGLQRPWQRGNKKTKRALGQDFLMKSRSVRAGLESKLITFTTGRVDLDYVLATLKNPTNHALPGSIPMSLIWREWILEAAKSVEASRHVEKPEVPRQLTREQSRIKRGLKQLGKKNEAGGLALNATNPVSRAWYMSKFNRLAQDNEQELPGMHEEVRERIKDVYADAVEHLLAPLRLLQQKFRNKSLQLFDRDMTAEFECFEMVNEAIVRALQQR